MRHSAGPVVSSFLSLRKGIDCPHCLLPKPWSHAFPSLACGVFPQTLTICHFILVTWLRPHCSSPTLQCWHPCLSEFMLQAPNGTPPLPSSNSLSIPHSRWLSLKDSNLVIAPPTQNSQKSNLKVMSQLPKWPTVTRGIFIHNQASKSPGLCW